MCSRWYLSYAGEDGFRGAVVLEADSFRAACAISAKKGLSPGGEVYGVPVNDDLWAEVSGAGFMIDKLYREAELRAFAECRKLSKLDGATYEPALDGVRLGSQLQRVAALMADGRWRTLAEIAGTADGSEAGVSARLRDMRKTRFGGHTVERRRRGGTGGTWEYHLKVFH